MRYNILVLIFSVGLFNAVETFASNCLVGGSDFETSSALFNPSLSNDGEGWFSEDLDQLLKKECGTSCEYSSDVEAATLLGMASGNVSSSATLTAKWSDYLTKNINNTTKGFAGIVANPRTISPYLNEGSGSNQFVIYGNGQNVSVLTYSVSGLIPGSSVTLSVDVYNLLSPDNLEKALQYMNEDVADPDDLETEIKLGRKLSYIKGELDPFTAPAPQLSVSTSQPGGFGGAANRKTTNKLDWGESQTLILTAKADNSGNVTFYFAGTNADFGPLSLDNLRIEGEFEPVIRVVGNPCPQMPAVLKLNSVFPDGTTYFWNEKSTGETSEDQSMIFFPPNPDNYTITCTVSTPDGCIATATRDLSVGECCDDGEGNPMALTDIYLDDFGRFSGSTYYYRDKNGNEQTVKAKEILVGNGNHGYSIDDQLNRGAAFAKELKYSGTNFRNGAYAIATENAYNSPATMFDATGEKGGAFLQIDMKGDGWLDKVVYEQEITDLCPERPISFSAAVGAINKKPTSEFATNATIQVRLVNSKTNEVILADGTPIEDTYVLDTVGWVEPRKTYDFKLPEGVESVKIQIISKEDDYKAAQRGDIALDDIAFRVCTPPKVEVVASSKTNDLLNLCVDDDFVLKAQIKAKGYFEKPIPGYLFQYTTKDPSDSSFDPISDWKDLGEVQEEDEYIIPDPANHPAFENVERKEKVRFRVVIGEFNYLKDQRALWESLDEMSPCRNVSFSTIPVEAALNCDLCEPVEKASIISADPSTLITINDNQEKEVVLCPDKMANLTTEAFMPTNPSVMGISVGPNDEPRRYVASWHKGSKNASGVAGSGSAAGSRVSFYNVTWKDADWYYLLVKDMEFPNEDGKVCWRWDSIHVVAADHPTEKLINPDEFCEGTLASEPIKTITGFKLDWYDGSDSVRAKSISEPVVGAVTQDESPKSFWYALNDEKTGCRGDMTEYVVKVQSVGEPLVSPITYLKTEVENGNVLKPTAQAPNAIVGESSCQIVWYNDDETGPIDEDDATPTPAEVVGLTGNLTKKYKIKQVNALGCESEFVPVSIIVSGYPAPTVKDFSVCENSPLLKDTLVATTNGVDGGNSASEFELVWYNSKEDGTIDDSQEFSKIELSPTIQKASPTERTKKYTYYVRQRLKSNPAAESAPVALTVTVYTNPKLAAIETAPKCLGESQNLKEMYNISIEDCEVRYYEDGTPTTADVTEAGKYLVTGSYVINKGEADEQTCSSEEEELNVVFHELKAELIGSDKTCPNVAVDLDLDLTLGGGLVENDLVYSWTNSLNNTKAKTKTYNTGSAGLNNAGDLMKVTVEVSSSACYGANAVKKVKEIVVGDGRLVGKIKISEPNNAQQLSDVISANNLSFNSCGGMVTVDLSDVANKNGGTYTLTGTETSTGSFSDETSGATEMELGAGNYTVSYINECPTSFSFKIVDKSVSAKSNNEALAICENEKWWAQIVDLKGPSNTTIEWQHDGNVIPNQTGKRLELNSAKTTDGGVYSFSLISEGCRFDQQIAEGNELVVYAGVDVTLSSVTPVCGDGEASVKIDVTPNEYVEELDWSDNPEGEVFGNMAGAIIIPVYDGSGEAPITKQYKVIAKNQYCAAKPYFIPVEVHKPLEGSIDAPSQICENDLLTLDASSYKADEYEWIYENNQTTSTDPILSFVPEPELAKFTLHVTRGLCEAEDSKTVEVIHLPVVAQVDSITYKTIEIQLDETNYNGPYKYVIDGKTDDPEVENNLRSGLSYATHTLMVEDSYGCQTEMTFVVNMPGIEIPIFITPNGDGENEKFVVKGLAEGYPDAEVIIFDRWGKKLASYRAGDDADWDGVYNGIKMPATDYWYEININDIDKVYTGHFTLIR